MCLISQLAGPPVAQGQHASYGRRDDSMRFCGGGDHGVGFFGELPPYISAAAL